MAAAVMEGGDSIEPLQYLISGFGQFSGGAVAGKVSAHGLGQPVGIIGGLGAAVSQAFV